MTDPYGPTARPDSAPPHPNVIRRFREELRLDRKDFADLLGCNIDTLRVWEAPNGSKPRGEAALNILSYAARNHYPMTIDDIFPTKRGRKKIKKNSK